MCIYKLDFLLACTHANSTAKDARCDRSVWEPLGESTKEFRWWSCCKCVTRDEWIAASDSLQHSTSNELGRSASLYRSVAFKRALWWLPFLFAPRCDAYKLISHFVSAGTFGICRMGCRPIRVHTITPNMFVSFNENKLNELMKLKAKTREDVTLHVTYYWDEPNEDAHAIDLVVGNFQMKSCVSTKWLFQPH